jgi:two-component system, OmpR family, alkaline phosphatase synthesis response regulator PhoP
MAKRVLIADDDAVTAHLLSSALRKRGFETRVARSGPEALAEAQDWLPELVILDVMMPEMHGYSVCSSLKSDTATNAIRIVILTAKPYGSDRRLALEMGADEYFTKPFDLQELVAKVVELTDHA